MHWAFMYLFVISLTIYVFSVFLTQLRELIGHTILVIQIEQEFPYRLTKSNYYI